MSDSRHIMLAIGMFLAVLILGGMALVLPNAREVSNIREREQDLQIRSDGVEQTMELVAQLSRMVVDAKQKIDTELKTIPNQPGVASMIRRLSLTIDRGSVLDQTFRVGATIEPLPLAHPTIRAVPVTMEMKATFEATYAVLRSIESMERLVRMRSINIRIADEQPSGHGNPIIETVLMIEAVYEEEEPGTRQ